MCKKVAQNKKLLYKKKIIIPVKKWHQKSYKMQFTDKSKLLYIHINMFYTIIVNQLEGEELRSNTIGYNGIESLLAKRFEEL